MYRPAVELGVAVAGTVKNAPAPAISRVSPLSGRATHVTDRDSAAQRATSTSSLALDEYQTVLYRAPSSQTCMDDMHDGKEKFGPRQQPPERPPHLHCCRDQININVRLTAFH